MKQHIRFNQIIEGWTVNGVKIPPENIRVEPDSVTIVLPRTVQEGDEVEVTVEITDRG